MTISTPATGTDIPWPVEAPDVRLGGLLLLESSVHPAGPPEQHEPPEDAEAPSNQRDWNVYCVRLAGDPAGREYALIGELFMCQGDWHLSVSALTPLQLRGELRADAHNLGPDELAKRYGPWATHVLWDFVAQHARLLSSGVLRHFDIPTQSPEAAYEVPAYLTEPED